MTHMDPTKNNVTPVGLLETKDSNPAKGLLSPLDQLKAEGAALGKTGSAFISPAGAPQAVPFKVGTPGTAPLGVPLDVNAKAAADHKLLQDLAAKNPESMNHPEDVRAVVQAQQGPSAAQETNPLIPAGTPTDMAGEMNSLIDEAKKHYAATVPTSTEQYAQLRDQLGLPATEARLADLDRIMRGSRDDIRRELTAAGGLVTDSAVNALADKRNEKLQDEATSLQKLYELRTAYADKAVALGQSDRKAAEDRFSSMFDLEGKSLDFKLRYQQAMFEEYQKPIQESNQAMQKYFLDLMGKYPDAGILPTDSVQDAAKKVQSSKLYAADLLKAQASIPGAITPAVLMTNASRILADDRARGGNMTFSDALQEAKDSAAVLSGVTPDKSAILYSGGSAYNFSGYAADPNWGTAVSGILNKIGKFDSPEQLQGYIDKNAKGTNVTADMIQKASEQYGVPWEIITAVMQHESLLGTSGVAVKNNNYGGITWNGQNGEKGTARPSSEGGNYVRYATPQEGVDALAQNIANRKTGAKAPTGADGGAKSDIQLIADAIVAGRQPAEIKSLYGKTAAVKAELERRGYDLTAANLDWQAIQKYTATLNGAAMTRLRQATEFAYESIPLVEDLSKQWERGGFPPLNKAKLIAAKNGLLGPEAQSIATKLDVQIADMQSELATVYRGGNAATDESLKKASGMLNADWSQSQFQSAVDLLKQNLTIRKNSIANVGAITPGGPATMPDAKSAAAAAGYDYDAMIAAGYTDEDIQAALDAQ